MGLAIEKDDSLFSKISKLVPGEFIALFIAATKLGDSVSPEAENYTLSLWLIISIAGIFFIVMHSEIKSVVHIVIYFFAFFVVASNIEIIRFSNSITSLVSYVSGWSEQYTRFSVVEPGISIFGPVVLGAVVLVVPKWMFFEVRREG